LRDLKSLISLKERYSMLFTREFMISEELSGLNWEYLLTDDSPYLSCFLCLLIRHELIDLS
jgi:hypothetical protein